MQQDNITIIGNVFVDIKGYSFRAVHKDAKNVGDVQIVHGGVGRNVAHNLGVMNANARFVSSVTQGGLGDEVLTVLRNVGVDTSYMQSFQENGMGIWLAVLQPDGELVVSISAQPDSNHQEEAILNRIDEYIRDSKSVGLDVGISRDVTERVKAACTSHRVPLFGVVGNLDETERNPESLHGFDVFVCNREEAEILVKHPVDDVNSAIQAAKRIVEYGCRACVVTLAELGCVVVDAETTHHLPANEVHLADSTGAGDAFFAGLIFSRTRGDSLVNAAQFGADVAGKVVSNLQNTLSDVEGLDV